VKGRGNVIDRGKEGEKIWYGAYAAKRIALSRNGQFGRSGHERREGM